MSLVPNLMFSIVPFIVILGFVLVFGLIIVRAVQGISQWNRNNNSPVLTVDSRVVSKRTAVSYHTRHHGKMHHHTTSSSTTYYATFEFESGDRLELCVPGNEYGYLVEGDMGRLTFQGTRYKGFQRSTQRGGFVSNNQY